MSKITYKVKTKDGREKTIVVEKTVYEPFHNEKTGAYVPGHVTRKLVEVDGQKYEGDCDVTVKRDRIILSTADAAQTLDRIDYDAKAAALENELDSMSSQEIADDYIKKL